MDDLSNSVEESLNRVRELTKCDDDQLIFRQVRSAIAYFEPPQARFLSFSWPTGWNFSFELWPRAYF